MQQVIIEPDTIGPWIGVAGVVLGILITTATDSLRTRRKERRERLRANQAAADELLAAANALIVVRGMFDMAVSPQGYGGQGDSPREWIELWMRQSERIQKASEELVRHGPDNLAVLGMKVARAASVTPIGVKEGFPEELEDLLTKFAAVMRTGLGHPGRAAHAGYGNSDEESIPLGIGTNSMSSSPGSSARNAADD